MVRILEAIVQVAFCGASLALRLPRCSFGGPDDIISATDVGGRFPKVTTTVRCGAEGLTCIWDKRWKLENVHHAFV